MKIAPQLCLRCARLDPQKSLAIIHWSHTLDNQSPLLELNSVSKTYRAGGLFSRRRINAVRAVDIRMTKEPSILAIVGESGSGKSTLAKMILRQEQQTSIHLTVDFYLRRTAINLLTLKDATDIEEAMEKALNEVGLSVERITGKYLHQFSGGELQRIAIARALIPDPLLIVADEPVSMVDASVRMNIINLFRDVMANKGVSFLYITHDLATAFYLADDLIIMQSGEIVERGKPVSVFDAPSHDYTKLLIESIPRIGEKWEELLN